jgi:hypothetical protein
VIGRDRSFRSSDEPRSSVIHLTNQKKRKNINILSSNQFENERTQLYIYFSYFFSQKLSILLPRHALFFFGEGYASNHWCVFEVKVHEKIDKRSACDFISLLSSLISFQQNMLLKLLTFLHCFLYVCAHYLPSKLQISKSILDLTSSKQSLMMNFI